ncbi:hypothetical protein CLIB1444_04S05622 [[Candida] jaroonii]|uniref:Uncharacterized protein n=1 Tax=[Candida] jaroonii TaxID=467808 RepID=A0ACA9Y6N5_9ASCO|nr:hypothetical protein CLIB1444_04S05622 [[Candida] jaroonii]
MPPVLPLEIVREIFDYLPIPTEELFGKGDGGAEKWENLKKTELQVNHGGSYNDPFDQYEYNEHHKLIQISHMSLESLFDCYNRPPFFPDGLELRIDKVNLGRLLGQGSIVQSFRIILDAVNASLGLELLQKMETPIKLGFVSSDSCDSWNLLKTTNFDSLELGHLTDTSELNMMPLKRLKLYQYDPSWSIDGVLKANVESLAWNIYCKDDWEYPLHLDLNFPNLKHLQLYLFCPYADSSVVIKLPEGLKEFKILGQMNHCSVNLPRSLKTFSTFVKLSATVEDSAGVQQPLTSYSQLPSLKSLSFNSGTISKSDGFPTSIEQLEIIWEMELDVDFQKLPNLKKISIHGVDPQKMFSRYEVEESSSPNSLTFKAFGKLYSIPFHESLETIHIMDTNDIEVISYPKLKCLELLNCGSGLFKNIPPDLKGLMVYSSKTLDQEKIMLPPNLEVFQLMFDDINKYVFGNVKHFFLSDSPFENFVPPNDLCTFEFTGSEEQTPECLDLSETKVSKFSFEVRELQGMKKKVVLPSTLRLLELSSEVEMSYDMDYTHVDKDILRRV